MSYLRKRHYQLLSVALGATIVAASAPLLAGASTKESATSVITAAKASMLKKVSVHVVVISKAGSNLSKVVVDIGSQSGQEIITSGAKVVAITITPKYAYLSGSATGLTGIMGLTSVQQKKIGSMAMAMKAGTPQYKSLTANLTTPVFASMLPAVKGTVLTKTGSARTKQYVLSWSSPASSTSTKTATVMSLSSGARTLPVTEKITSASGSGITTYSKWGEKVTPKVPTATISYASVFG